MSTLKSSAENLTLNADGSNNDIIFQSNGSNVATLDQAGLLTATTFAGSGASLTALPAANITGTLPAISGANLTNLPAGGVGKNLIINGAFQVWQRGTSATHSSSYLADRWKNYSNSETVSRQAFTPGQTDVPGFPTYYHRMGGGSSNWYILDTRIEDVGVTGGQEVTLSYWMKGSSAFTNLPYQLQNFGLSGSTQIDAAIASHSVTTSWVRYNQTFTMPSITGKTIGAGSYIMISVFRASLTDIVVDVANVKLEIGDTMTDFVPNTYAEELAACQRYYYELEVGSGSLTGVAVGTTRIDFGVTLPVPLRVAPSIAANGHITHRSGNANSSANNVTEGNFFADSVHMKLRAGGHSGVSDEEQYSIEPNTQPIQLDSEL